MAERERKKRKARYGVTVIFKHAHPKQRHTLQEKCTKAENWRPKHPYQKEEVSCQP